MENIVDTKTVELALGRILRLASRPSQPGDVAEYERCRSLILDQLVGVGVPALAGYTVNYVRDRRRGAQGD